jgi:UDP-glucose 4-epimerase
MLHIISMDEDGCVLYNLGTGDTCSVSKIAQIVVEESGLEEVDIDYTGGKRGWAGDVPKTYLDVTMLLDSGFEPSAMSEDAIRETARDLIAEIGL